MCRWLAYAGSPVLVEELLYGPKNSLVVQSLHSQMGAEETNGYSTDVRTLRAIYPENELLREVGDEARLIVSEPLGDALPGAWNKVPESTYGVIQPGQDEIHPFTPVADPVAVARA